MGENSAISWTDHTFNPWHGCTKIAHPEGSGCDHCYAETLSIRWGKRTIWGKHADRRELSEGTWAQPGRWNADAERRHAHAFVFCASMGDVFEDRRDLDASRARLFTLIEQTPWLVWLLLTKRPERVLRLVPSDWLVGKDVVHHAHTWIAQGQPTGWWPSNAWVGASVEHQAAAELRIPRLLEVPAQRRFLSCEPLLGPIDVDLVGIDWVIVGGESGAGHRDLDLQSLADIVDRCASAGVPVWVKQDSGPHPGHHGRIPAGLWRQQRPLAAARLLTTGAKA